MRASKSEHLLDLRPEALTAWATTQGIKSQEDLATHLGVHGSNISRILRRETAPSTLFVARVLAAAAAVPGADPKPENHFSHFFRIPRQEQEAA